MRNGFLLPAALASVVATLPGAAQATSTTCATSTVCAEYINTYSGSSGGVAIHGEANSGIGVRGTSVKNTGFYGASGSGNFLMPGVEGESTNNSGMDVGGAFGLAGFATGTFPQYGVVGYGSLGVGGEAEGKSNISNGFNAGIGGFDETGYQNAGVQGFSYSGTGGVFEAYSADGSIPSIPTAVLAIAEPPTGSGTADGALAIEAESTRTAFEAQNTYSGMYVDIAQGTSNYISGSGGIGFFSITQNGNETLSGTLTTSKGTYVRTAGTSGTARIAYGTRSTAPEIEDVGEGNLVNGRGVVAIDPALADTIDMRRAYHVFLTPEGDCKGLYVTQKSPGSFVVRELQGGRSNLAFEYRVVAKPHDENGERLARAAAPEHPRPPIVAASSGKHASRFLSPEARLKQLLGPVGYAKAIADLGRRIAGK